MKNSILFIAFFLCTACSDKYSPEIEAVLKQAGDNRKELANVLKHYSREPADSLKLRAAEFLILNMTDTYSEYYDAPWNNVATAYLRWSSSSNRQLLVETYGLGKPVVQEDVKYITGEYLINNIEVAFKVWREQPWGKHITFGVFCEEILPYRVDTEPLENWREKALASFADLNRSFKEEPDITAVDACSRVNNLLPRFRIDNDFPPMNYSQLMATPRSSCAGMATLAIFAMRGLGIPVTVDYTPQWVNHDVGHVWNTVRDSLGKHIPFMGAESNPGRPVRSRWSLRSKTYRNTFARQTHLTVDEADIPPSLRNAYILDVSGEYGGCTDVDVPMRFPSPAETRYVYLAAMGERTWNITGWGNMEGQRLRFCSVGTGALYLPLYYSDNRITSAGYPFFLYADSVIHVLEPDTVQLQSLSLSGISPYDTKWSSGMLSGVFEGANREDFSDACPLHIIKETPEDNHFNTVKVKNPVGYRYFRYVSPKEGQNNCNVAEIKLYDAGGKQLHGKPIGTPDVLPTNPTMTSDKAFDNDVLTYYEAAGNDSWTGLDLGAPQRISEIRYLPRTVAFGIYEGHVYELFYWNQNWQSLGKKEVTDYPLQYQVPSNALFYLENITIHKNEMQVFIAKDGIQQWTKHL